MIQEPKGINKFSTFITADALLAAILMVWAQLWIQPSVRLWSAYYGTDNQTEVISETLKRFDLNVGFGLVISFLAIFFTLVALAWATYHTLSQPNDSVPNASICLFKTALVITLFNVVQSVYTILVKVFCSSYLIWEPLKLPWNLICFLLAIITLVVVYLIYKFKIE